MTNLCASPLLGEVAQKLGISTLGAGGSEKTQEGSQEGKEACSCVVELCFIKAGLLKHDV